MRNPNIACLVCGTMVYRRPSQIKAKNGNVYCSMSCYGISCRKQNPCVVCSSFVPSDKNKKTCSNECATKYRSDLKRNHCLGRKKKLQPKLTTRSYRTRVRKEKGSSCEMCGYNKVEDILALHHIIPRSQGGSDEISNLQLLCPNCHGETHFRKRV